MVEMHADPVSYVSYFTQSLSVTIKIAPMSSPPGITKVARITPSLHLVLNLVDECWSKAFVLSTWIPRIARKGTNAAAQRLGQRQSLVLKNVPHGSFGGEVEDRRCTGIERRQGGRMGRCTAVRACGW